MKDLFIDIVNESDKFTDAEKEALKGLWKVIKIAGEAQNDR